MKKVLSILLVSALLLSNIISVYADTDYEQSFAKEDIKYLMSLGAINSSKAVYPERNITRAEFVKIINKAFSFNEKAEENFPDIQADKWYYNEFLTAKKQGYITGNESGLVTPEKNLTRAEAAVILSRIIEVKISEAKKTFADQNIIPEWASDSISQLVSAGIISGYPDGSFKPYNNLTRAEAFALTVRSINFNKENSKTEETPSASPETPPVPAISENPSAGKISHSGGGGSGGGGGSSSKDKKVSLPIINQFNENASELTFTTVANAKSYTITASYDIYSESKEINETAKNKSIKVDLSDIIAKITENIKLPEVPVLISIKTNAAKGYTGSATKEIGTITKKFTFLASPDVNVEIEVLPESEHLVISWNEIENADDYNLSLTADSADLTSSVLVNKQSRVVVIKDLSLINSASEVKFEISALSNSSGFISSVPTVSIINYSAFGSTEGTGTEDDPYIIRNADDFELIRTNLDKHFLLASNITIDGNFEPFGSFSGSLKGYDTETGSAKKRTINLTINQPGTDKVGLFKELTGSAQIDSIVIEGSVSGNSIVGAVAGTSSSGNISITNCVNKADITTTANNTGGIIGSLSVGGTATPKINLCSNLGNITSSASNVGGIIGYPNINSTTVGISNCSNYGNVVGASNVGGIVGAAYAGVTKSFNAGCVESLSGGAGGIACVTSKTNDPISYCYNVGNVTASSIAGGIAYGPGNASSSILVKFCYYAGESLIGNNNVFPITSSNSLSSVTNNFYVLENNTNEIAGTTSVTSEELSDPNNSNTKILLNGEDDENKFIMTEDFDYPQIPTNLFGISNLNLPVSSPENPDAAISGISWETSDERISKYKIKIIDKSTYDIILNEEISCSGSGSEFYEFNFDNDVLYEIIITGITENNDSSDSVALFKKF